MQIIPIFLTGGVNRAAWHKKRYTAEQIKKIQVALNKAALGHQISVDGKISSETIEAIKQFQLQHSDSLKVDGLAGDKTLSALGVTGIGDSSLTATRPGLNQGRKSPGTTAGVSQAENERARAYYTSPEMIKYLLNATNARTDPQYYNHYQNALNYVSPEIAARLRNINDEGDAYDADVSRLHNEAVLRERGILELKNAISSGYLKPDQYDKWAKDHHLSKEEMLELLEDPAVLTAMLAAGILADNGRINSLKAQSLRFLDNVSLAMSDFGVNYALPFMGFTGAAAFGAVPSFVGGTLGGEAVDGLVRLGSKGEYDTFGDWVTRGTNPDYRWAVEYLNPGTLIGAGFGGLGRTTRPVGFKAGQVRRYPRITYKGRTYGTIQQKTPNPNWGPSEGGFADGGPYRYKEVKVMTNSGQARPNPNAGKTYRTRDKTIYENQWTWDPYLFDKPSTDELGLETPPVIEVPTFDTGITYGPYTTQNRFVFKAGGTLNYLNFFK